jgi:hypothetical protein
MFNTVGDLIDYTRLQLYDPLVNNDDTRSLWSDDELIKYADASQQEFSKVTKCLLNSSDFTVSTVASTADYAIDEQIIEVYGGYLSTSKIRVFPINRRDLDRSFLLDSFNLEKTGNWEDDRGTPRYMILDMNHNYIRLYPIPTTVQTLTLYVSKVADAVTTRADSLEIDDNYRHGLSYRMLSLAYGKQDAETSDLQKSMLFAQKWQSFIQDAVAYYANKFMRVSTNVPNR